MEFLYFLLKILCPYVIAGFVDFWFKERRKQKIFNGGGTLDELSDWFEHTWNPPGWHLKIASIWIVLFVIEVVWFHLGYEVFLGIIVFYTEDWFYYFFRFIWYGRIGENSLILPDKLPWLHANFSWYKKIVGEDYPVSSFNAVLIGSWALMLLIYYWV